MCASDKSAAGALGEEVVIDQHAVAVEVDRQVDQRDWIRAVDFSADVDRSWDVRGLVRVIHSNFAEDPIIGRGRQDSGGAEVVRGCGGRRDGLGPRAGRKTQACEDYRQKRYKPSRHY